MAILAASGTRWVVSQGFFALGMLVPAVGFSLLTLSLRPLPLGWLIFLGAAAFLIGAINGAYLIYRQTLDPAALVEDTLPIPNIIGYLYIILSLLGGSFLALRSYKAVTPIGLVI